MRKKQGIRIGATGLDGLEQEIRMLLATRKGSLPLDRDYGLTWEYVDLPMPEAMPYMISEIAVQLEKYVPRIKVRDIVFKSDDPVEGILQPTVTVEIREKYYADFR
ncbi:MAG: GPW/gp25 family protein [Desulfovibrio sp.]|nr:GPW/gp25 family protein [Desulfovibrio sp.]